MKNKLQFSKRGALMTEPPLEAGKLKISIRLDHDIVDRFLVMADQTGNGYQTLMNNALRAFLDGSAPTFEQTLRTIIREELVMK